jgi:hypothetical protein
MRSTRQQASGERAARPAAEALKHQFSALLAL